MATMYIALEAGIGLGALASGWLHNHIMGKPGVDASFAVAGVLALAAVVYLSWFWRTNRPGRRHRLDEADEMTLLDGEP